MLYFLITIYSMFFRHPSNVCMSYFQHMKFALRLSYHFFLGTITTFIHAFIPDIFVKTPTDISKHIHHLIENSGCRK
jgi:hypothetical protein